MVLSRNGGRDRGPSRALRLLWACWGLLLVVAWAIPVLAHFPGGYTPDTVSQVAQAITGSYGDWHPPAMAAWWRAMFHATGTLSTLLLFHHLLLLAALLWLARLIAREGARWTLVLVAAVPLLPVVANFSGILWKDIGVAFSLALAAVAAAWSARGPWRVARNSVVVVACLYAAAIRLNAIPAVFPILLLAFWPARTPKSTPARTALRATAMALAATVACAVAPPLFGYKVLGAHRQHVSGFLQLMDLAGILDRTGADAIPPFALSSPAVSRQLVDAKYRRSAEFGSANFLFFKELGEEPPLVLPRSDSEAAALTRAWLSAVAQHPAAYLQHRAVFWRKLMRIGEPTGYYHYVLPQERRDVEALFRDVHPPEVRSIVLQDFDRRVPFRDLSRRIVRRIVLSTESTFLFRGWSWAVLELALLVGAAALRRRSPRLAAFVATCAASGLLYCASYFPVTPASDFRYLYWTVLSGVLGSIAALAAIWPVRRKTKTLLSPS